MGKKNPKLLLNRSSPCSKGVCSLDLRGKKRKFKQTMMILCVTFYEEEVPRDLREEEKLATLRWKDEGDL